MILNLSVHMRRNSRVTRNMDLSMINYTQRKFNMQPTNRDIK